MSLIACVSPAAYADAEWLIWNGTKNDTWLINGTGFWLSAGGYRAYEDGDYVLFKDKGVVNIASIVEPGNILVDVEKSLVFQPARKTEGCIAGEGEMTKTGSGTLTIKSDNSFWKGDISLEEGKLKIGHADALGMCVVTVSGGATLDMGNKALVNDVTISGKGVIKGGKKFSGSLTLNGDLLKGSLVDVKHGESVVLLSGTVSGQIKGDGEASVTGNSRVEGKITTRTLKVAENATLTVGSKGMKMGKESAVTLMAASSLLLEGKFAAYSLYSQAAAIRTSDYKSTPLTFKGNIILAAGSTMSVNGNLKAGGLSLSEGSAVTLQYVSPRSVKLEGDLSITDSGMTLYGKLQAANLIMYANDAAPQNTVLSLMGPRPQSITLKEDAKLTGATLNLSGKLSAVDLSMSESELVMSMTKMQSVTLKGTAELDHSNMEVFGKMKAENLHLADSTLTVTGTTSQSLTVKETASLTSSGEITRVDLMGKFSASNLLLNPGTHLNVYGPKAQSVKISESLSVGSGASLTLNGKLQAGDMIMKTGARLVLNGKKLQTITVKGNLILESGSIIDLGAYDFSEGKMYKLITFNSYSGVDAQELASVFGVTEGSGCILSMTDNAITLTLAKGASWAPEFDDEVDDGTAAQTDVGVPVAPAITTSLVNPALPDYSGVADALVQADWGLVESSRAFVNTIANRSMAVQLGSGERSVWASAIAGSSRRSSSGTHGGADTNITGGAIGMETQLGENSLLGMALGNSWTRVSAHNYGTIKQDTTHLGLYGQTNWKKLSADWSAAYGRSESKFNGSDWSQRAIQLDGRLSYNHALSETVLLRGFGGVQYYASDSARVDGIYTGEVQNLRGEIGVGIVRSTYKSSVYAELALHQDLVRDNPEVRSPFGQRYHGTNPGRTGINFTIGGSYALSDQWSVNASYAAEVVENANAHSVNVGATYKF